MMNLEPITIGIILANVLPSIKGFEDDSFIRKYLFNISAIQNGQHFRMITSGFLHADIMHLVFNMLTLYFFANTVIYSLGPQYFLLIYVASLLFGNALSYYFHKNEPHYSALGASGAVSGVLFAGILLNPTMDMYVMFVPFAVKGYIVGIFYLVFSIYGMKKQFGNIGHDAHFGGAVAGFILTLILRPSILVQETQIVILLALPIIALFVLIKSGKI
ncbi:rhomboid family intramembrane serine protease [uncultured Kordia sp.]|uniref:rhomboid family intramembrane serine protease n=1 Tax=uncultured Kordia sp. TaxID=507699 RepID=UPI00345C199D